MRAPLVVLVASTAVCSGCTCGARSGAPAPDGSAERAVDPAAARSGQAPGTMETAAELSAPIGAARASGGAVLVAGLVVARRAIALSRIEASGARAWSTDVLAGVAWTPDADVRVYAAPDGGALVLSRVLRDGKQARILAGVDAAGQPRGEAEDVGSAACAVDEGVSWVRRDASGRSALVARAWTDARGRPGGALPAGDPILVCGAHRVFALVEGDDGLDLVQGDETAPLLRARDFTGGDDRDHLEYTAGDELGVVSPGLPGVTAFREVDGEKVGAWRRLAHRLEDDDDVVAVDADAASLFVLATRDDGEPCADGDHRTRLRLLRASRKGAGELEAVIAPFDCGVSAGPYWTGFLGGHLVAAWPERAPRDGGSSAPVTGLAFVTLDGDRPSDVTRLPIAADAMVDAGCDAAACYAVALTRPEGTDGMAPGAARVLRYPR